VLGGDASGVGTANSGSVTDQITRSHKMTLDEATLILNVKSDDSVEQVLKSYEHLFKANSPPPPPEKPIRGKVVAALAHSHYLQSKLVRARERIEAEFKVSSNPAGETTSETTHTTPPPSNGPQS